MVKTVPKPYPQHTIQPIPAAQTFTNELVSPQNIFQKSATYNENTNTIRMKMPVRDRIRSLFDSRR